jgi:hypothetical protein
MADGFVALLDVLGFSNMVSGENGPRKIFEYQTALESTLVDNDDEGLRYVAFSDTIVITTHGNRLEDFLNLANRCSALFASMLEREIPIRGSIARGFYARGTLQANQRGERSVFVAGSAVLEAYRFEQQQNWLGIMLAPSTVKTFPDLRKLCELSSTNRESLQTLPARISCAALCSLAIRFPSILASPSKQVPLMGSPSFRLRASQSPSRSATAFSAP